MINSCAVTQDAVKKSKQLIRRVHRDNPQAKLVVSGCYATLNESEAAQLMGVDLIVGNNDKNQLVERTLSELNMDSMPAMSTEPGEVSLFSRGRQRAFVKVQDGCRYRCTFCIVTVARGEERSRSIDEVVAEINALHAQASTKPSLPACTWAVTAATLAAIWPNWCNPFWRGPKSRACAWLFGTLGIAGRFLRAVQKPAPAAAPAFAATKR